MDRTPGEQPARDPRRGQLALPAADRHTAGDAEPVVSGPVHHDGQYLGELYVPAQPVATRFVVALHGAGGSAEGGMGILAGAAERGRLALFAPQSAGRTWDLIQSRGYGPDTARIQQALNAILPGLPVTNRLLTFAGFSDGASYALSLGLINGDIVDAVVAFSPGFVGPGTRTGTPACFVSHGHADRVLPINRCSRIVVPALLRAGYLVEYHEFDGGHEIPPPVVAEAMRWLSTVDRNFTG